MPCLNFQWENKYQKVHTLHSLFFLSFFPSILLRELHNQVLVKDVRSEFSLFSCARYHHPSSNARSLKLPLDQWSWHHY